MNTLNRGPAAVIGARFNTDIAPLAYELLIETLERHGNVPSDAEREAFYKLMHVYAYVMLGLNRDVRYAADMDLGAGKTTSIVALCAAIHRLGRDRSVLIAQSEVDEMIKTKAEMLALGIPESDIAVIYRSRRAGDRPDDELSVPRRRFVIITHAMLKVREDISVFNRYGDRERDLVIYDESLVKGKGRFVNLATVRRALVDAAEGASQFTGGASDRTRLAYALAYLKTALEALEGETVRQAAGGLPAPLTLPQKSMGELLEYGELLHRVRCPELYRVTLQSLLSLTCEENLRVTNVAQGSTSNVLLTYDLQVPAEITRVVVLDASFAVRALTSQLDRRIEKVDFNCRARRYPDVTVTRIKVGGGGSTLDGRMGDAKFLSAIAERVKAQTEGHAGLICTFKEKPRERDHAGPLRRVLSRLHGVPVAKLDDLKVTVWVREGAEWVHREVQRYNWLTWGRHLGNNDYRHCSYGLALGIYRMSDADLVGTMAAQLEDHLALELSDRDLITSAARAEVLHHLTQFAGRLSLRTATDGVSLPAAVDWLGLEEFDDALAEHFPGCTTETMELEGWTPQRRLKYHTEFLEAVAELSPGEAVKFHEFMKESLGIRSTATRGDYLRACQDSETPLGDAFQRTAKLIMHRRGSGGRPVPYILASR